MKNFLDLIKHYLLMASLLVAAPLSAQTDTTLDQQKADCAKNSAMEWSSQLNRCIQKIQAQTDRHEADNCNVIQDISQREACHKALAEKKTGLSSDPNSLKQGNTTGSMMMNAAYSIVSLINSTGSSSSKSSCTSKTIFGVTAVAGLASDFYLKYKAKKKIKELTDKYKLDAKNGSMDSQVKALEYLKEEQQTVADIASLEKKRNMLLMMGYGAAGVMAAVELAMPAMNPECNKGDENKSAEGEKKTETANKDNANAETANAETADVETANTEATKSPSYDVAKDIDPKNMNISTPDVSKSNILDIGSQFTGK
ncbi:MAG: hypothetical protein ACXVCE_15510 [Bacteriovorax sp.]